MFDKTIEVDLGRVFGSISMCVGVWLWVCVLEIQLLNPVQLGKEGTLQGMASHLSQVYACSLLL